MSFAKTDEPIEMPFGSEAETDSIGPIKWGCALAPTSDYDGSICAALAMQAIAAIIVATC